MDGKELSGLLEDCLPLESRGIKVEDMKACLLRFPDKFFVQDSPGSQTSFRVKGKEICDPGESCTKHLSKEAGSDRKAVELEAAASRLARGQLHLSTVQEQPLAPLVDVQQDDEYADIMRDLSDLVQEQPLVLEASASASSNSVGVHAGNAKKPPDAFFCPISFQVSTITTPSSSDHFHAATSNLFLSPPGFELMP